MVAGNGTGTQERVGTAPATVISGAPEDPVGVFRGVPLPAWERRGADRDIHDDGAEGIAKITIARPEVPNAFRHQTLFELAGDATMLFYLSEEGQEGRNAYQQHQQPDFAPFPRRP